MTGEVRDRAERPAHHASARIEVPDGPHLEEAGVALFFNQLEACTAYLEFGSGGSTVAAAGTAKPFVSVESDQLFLSAVKRRADGVNRDHKGTLIWADIGPVGAWGFPADGTRTAERLAQWKRYSQTPWSAVESAGIWPDLILIDGRFRVASALSVILHLPKDADWVMLVDDYGDRPCYHIVAKHARLERMVGRMAVFRPGQASRDDVLSAWERFATDFR